MLALQLNIPLKGRFILRELKPGTTLWVPGQERKKILRWGEPISEPKIWDNVVCNGLKNTLADAVDETNPTAGTYIAIGNDDTTAVAASDTTLHNEVFRVVKVSGAVVANIITLSFFVTAGEDSTTWEEWGVFGDGASASADSGVMYNHALISPVYDHTAGTTDVQIDWELTIG